MLILLSLLVILSCCQLAATLYLLHLTRLTMHDRRQYYSHSSALLSRPMTPHGPVR